MKQVLTSLGMFIDNAKRSPEIQDLSITDVRKSGSDVVGTMRLLTMQDVDESNPNSQAMLECEFDVVFGFEEDEDLENWGVSSLSADESPDFKFVGCCAGFEADESVDWAYELNNRLCPFDMSWQMGIDEDAEKQALALRERMLTSGEWD